MNFTVRFKEMDEPLGIKDFINKKLIKLSKFDWIQEEIKIELRRYDKENQFKASIVVYPNGSNTVNGEAKSDNLNTAFDSALEKVITQLKKIKESRTDYK